MIRAISAAAALVLPLFLPVGAPAQGMLLPDERGIVTIAPMLERVTPAVVNIGVVSQQPVNVNPLFRDPFFRRFFDLPDIPRTRPRMSAGSGVIVDAEEGLVLTNHHVISGGDRITVTLKDRREIDAELIGSDPATDIAVLRIDADNLTDIPFGDSEILKVGDFVVAIGNPFGLGQTVTSGIISALGRSGINPDGYEDFIQTDASINPGNSGGALVTLDGRLIGINTAIVAPAGGNVGIGFAVPIDMARAVMDQLVEYGEVTRGRLGVTIQELTPELAEAMGTRVARGAVVAGIEPGSAAEAAGLEIGDVVVEVDGIRIDGTRDLRNRIARVRPGSEVELTVLRGGERIRTSTELERTEARQVRLDAISPALSGAVFEDMRPGLPGHGRVPGVAVTTVAPGSPAARAGLRPGDVVMAINDRPVRSVGDLAEALDGRRGQAALRIYRNGASLLLVVPV